MGVSSESLPADAGEFHALQRELESTRRKFESLLQNLPGVVYRRQVEPEQKLLWVDDRLQEMLGLDADDAVAGRVTLRDVIVPQDRARVAEGFRTAAAARSSYDMTYTVDVGGGRSHVIHDVGHVSEMDGSLIADGIMFDVTERAEQERILRDAFLAEHRRYETVVMTSGQVVYEYDLASGVVTLSPSLLSVFGYTQESYGCTSEAWLEKVHPEDRERVRRESRASIAAGHGVDLEYRFRHADGSFRWVWDHSLLTTDEDHRPANLLGLMQDITTRKQMEAQIASAQRMETIGALAGGVAHDVNNYLTTIMGNLDLALMQLDGGADSPELSDARKAAEGCAGLVRSLLTFARQQSPIRTHLDPAEILNESVRILRRLVGPSISLHTDLQGNCPFFEADRLQVQQVLMNLVINARDAMNGTGAITIGAGCTEREHPELRLPGQFVRLWVRDNGPGIPPSLQQRIFEPYFTTRPFGEGTGLGLSIVHGIARAHGGWAEVESSAPRGATFSVYFPAL